MTFKFETQSIRIGTVPSPFSWWKSETRKDSQKRAKPFFPWSPARFKRETTGNKTGNARKRGLLRDICAGDFTGKVRKSNGTLARWCHWTTTRQAIVFSIFCEESLTQILIAAKCILVVVCKCTILTQLNECAPRRFVISGDGIFSPHLVIIVSLRMTDFSISWIIFSCCLISWE